MKNNFLKQLSSNKGIGKKTILNFKKKLGLNTRKKNEYVGNYTGIVRTKKLIKLYKISSILNLIQKKRINHLINLRSFKGLRHKNKYPVRGQRTHTNAKTQKKLNRI